MATDDFEVFTLTDDEIKALEDPYKTVEPTEPKPAAKAEAAPQRAAPAQAAAEPESRKGGDDPEVWMKRIRDAEERAARERERRIAAEKTAHDRATSLTMTEAKAAEGEYWAVNNALAKTDSEIASLKAAHKAALESGDYDAATEAADKLATARAQHTSLTDGKAALEDRVRQTREKAKTQPEFKPTADAPDNSFEARVSQISDPKVQSWFRTHPEALTDPKLNARAIGAHHLALAEGIEVSSDAYFAYVDKQMGYAKDQPAKTADPEDNVVVDTRKTPAPKIDADDDGPSQRRVAAPVSRDSILQRGPDGRQQIRLTREQKQMADDLGMSPTAYAKHLLQAERDGMLSEQRGWVR